MIKIMHLMEDIDYNKYLENNFIEYWDRVIHIWVKGKGGKEIEAHRSREECLYKDGKNGLNVRVEKEQSLWFDKNSPMKNILCPIHMPEPYWGDPKKCSIVIVDYNPAGGHDMNPHTYRGDGTYLNNTMIKYVNNNKYSDLAKIFPILDSKKELENSKFWWLRSYEGRQWWRKKLTWMLHLIESSGVNCHNSELKGVAEDQEEWPKDVYRPFAIELCGWHSPNWTNFNMKKFNANLIKTICCRFVTPLLLAIEDSTSKMAVCIGAQFSYSNLKIIICNLEDKTQVIRNILCNCNNNCNKRYIILNDQELQKKKLSDESKGSIGVVCNKGQKNERTRYYRVYNVIKDNKNHIILNTFAPGGNHHSSEYFWDFEKELLKVVKSVLK